MGQLTLKESTTWAIRKVSGCTFERNGFYPIICIAVL